LLSFDRYTMFSELVLRPILPNFTFYHFHLFIHDPVAAGELYGKMPAAKITESKGANEPPFCNMEIGWIEAFYSKKRRKSALKCQVINQARKATSP